MFEQLTAVAEDADCKVHFGQVSRHLCQHADDGSFGDGRRGYHRFSGDYSDLEIGEDYDDEIVIDRWYHKSAVVLWPNSQHFDVIAQMGTQYSIDQFLKLMAKREKLKSDKRLQATGDCIKLAEAIIRRWPDGTHHGRSANDEQESMLISFAEIIPTLENAEVLVDFLRTLAQRDPHLDLTQFVQVAMKMLGSDRLLPLLSEFIADEQKPNQYGIVFVEGLTERDAAWLCELCQSPTHRQSPGLGRLLAIGVEKIHKHVIKLDKGGHSRSAPPTPAWLQLCKTCLHIEFEPILKELLNMPSKFPKVFDLRTVQVPASIMLREWSQKVRTDLPPSLAEWMASIRNLLQSATASKPIAPLDLARKSDTGCDCQYCKQLSQFLSDRELEHADIAAREDMRYHLENAIRNKQLDVIAELNRSRRPYSLQLTKTIGSYKHALEQFETDLKLLASLDSPG